jgi:hypothetical protein
MKRSMVALLALSTLVVGAVACEKVNKPTSDSTPPILTWHVENLTQSTTADYTGNGTVTGKKDDEFRVTLTAHDPEGIQKITMGGGYTRSCAANGVGQSAQGDYATQTQTLSPDSNGKVLVQIFLIQSITPDITCSQGFDWKGTTISLVGTGTNYFNGTTSATLSLTVTP